MLCGVASSPHIHVQSPVKREHGPHRFMRSIGSHQCKATDEEMRAASYPSSVIQPMRRPSHLRSAWRANSGGISLSGKAESSDRRVRAQPHNCSPSPEPL